MSYISAYLSFKGQCREAMHFYQSCLGGDLSIQSVGESPVAAQCPESIHHQVMHSSLTSGGILLLGSDMEHPRYPIHKGNQIGLCIQCSSEEEIHRFFTKLSAEGKIIEPIQKQFWGALFGELEDRFGTRWMFHYEIK